MSKDSSVQLSDHAYYDGKADLFRVPLMGHKEFAALVIARDAPLPLTHLAADEHKRATPLGVNLRDHLEAEVKAALGRGAHQVATGIALMTHEELKELEV
jgi:hypothetical protein